MKRVYNDAGQWTDDAQEGANIAAPFLEEAFKALEAKGFNPREAGHIIDAETIRISSRKMVLRFLPARKENPPG